MTNFDSQSSATYQVIANLLRYIEGLGFPKSDWCIYDNGQTLEVTTELYDQISQTAEFQAFESIGGCYSLEDGNPYLPELESTFFSSDSEALLRSADRNHRMRLKHDTPSWFFY